MSGTVMFFVIGFLVNAALALLAIILADRHRRRHIERLRRARGGVKRTNAEEMPGIKTRTRPVALGSGQFFGALERKLTQAGLRLSVGELLTQVGLGVLGLYALAVLLAGLHPITALPIAVMIPLGVAALVLKIARVRYMAAFTVGLPEALDVFARGLRAGRPVADSLAIVVESAKGPIQREFMRCHHEITMGTELSDSLDRLSLRVPTPEVCFFAVATALQTETGGNLIETMESLATQLRERRKLRKKARALSSEARASAIILASLPFAVAGVILVLNGGYLEPLWADSRGQLLALAGIGNIALGIFMMVRMGKLDV